MNRKTFNPAAALATLATAVAVTMAVMSSTPAQAQGADVVKRDFARTVYLSLYKMHQVALHGWWKTALGSASRLLTRSTEPRVKLH